MASNNTIADPSQCTYATCSVKQYGQLLYIPSLAGNALFLSLFATFLLAQVAIGVRYKTWTYLTSLSGGIALEIIGYTSRIMLHQNVFIKNYFIIYLVGLTIGPAFFSAAIYLCLTRIIAVYGTSLSYFKGKTITAVFISCDIVALILQAAGGAIVSTAGTHTLENTGLNIMIAGLSSQVATTTVFGVLALHLAWSIYRKPQEVNPNSLSLRKTAKFRFFLIAIATATIAILIRCSFRVAELKAGFGSSLANNEVAFMVLDGAMMIVAVTCLTVAHPGPVFGPIWHNSTGPRVGKQHTSFSSTPAEGGMRMAMR